MPNERWNYPRRQAINKCLHKFHCRRQVASQLVDAGKNRRPQTNQAAKGRSQNGQIYSLSAHNLGTFDPDDISNTFLRSCKINLNTFDKFPLSSGTK